MTKCVVLGEPKKEQKKKPIEFIWVIANERTKNKSKQVVDACCLPREFNHVELVQISNSQDCFDIMFAYDYDRSDGCLYLGHWNDGVAE